MYFFKSFDLFISHERQKDLNEAALIKKKLTQIIDWNSTVFDDFIMNTNNGEAFVKWKHALNQIVNWHKIVVAIVILHVLR